MKTITVILEKGKDGYGVSYKEIPNIYGFGETIDAAKKDAQDAIDGFVETLNMRGRTIPEILRGEYQLNFTFDTSSLFEFIGSTITQSAVAKASGINAALLSHYATRRKKPRDIQRQKIVMGLHKIGNELLAVS
ncbi:hypothetical protein FACS189456_6290 [Bacteroidia bacterium]|nr:hypothetical protein FACS189456_6290 [Bacteroidia bacterium]